ncbi:MAG: hypothetical protein M3466_13265 [Gemmatimonadota bacterium]|nr:hypothetical protein [Gemmatimonadota bacterium]
MTLAAIRPLSSTEILDAAFQMYRRIFVPLVMLGAIGFLPFLIITFGFLASGNTTDPRMLTILVILLLPALLWYAVADAAMILITSEHYRARLMTPAAALRAVVPRFGRILLAALGKYGFLLGGFIVLMIMMMIMMFLIGLAIRTDNAAAFGVVVALFLMLVLVAWSLYALSRYFAIPGVVVLEDLSARAALARARVLSKGEIGKICKVYVITVLLIFIANAVVSVAVMIPFGMASLAANGFASLFNALSYPFFSVVTTLLYYDVRVRKEGYDLELMEQDLTAQAKTA